MTEDERSHLLARLRALMSRTVANGCTVDEELAAARAVSRTIGQLDAASPPAAWARDERADPGFQALLERNTLESLLKAAVRELALGHINTVSPPRRRIPAPQPVEWVGVPELVEPPLAMMLGAGNSRLARTIITRTIAELIDDGQLPPRLAIPLTE